MRESKQNPNERKQKVNQGDKSNRSNERKQAENQQEKA